MTKIKTLMCGMVAATLACLIASAPARAQEQKKITILTWNLPIYGKEIAGWTQEFHQKYPDIQVEWIDKKGTDWATFYQAQLAAGTAPDIVNIQGSLWAEYAAAGQLLDLTPYLAKDSAFKSRFTPGALELWSASGKNWLVPWYFTKTLLFGNEPLMKASGIAAMPRSFDELMASAAKVKGAGKSGFLTTNFDWLYWPLFKMNGVDILDPTMHKAAFDTPAGLATLTKLATATKSGVINNVSWTGRWVEPNSVFASGNVAFYMAPASALFWAAGKADWISEKTVAITEVPGQFAVPNSHGFGVSKSTKYAEAAVYMIKIATSDQWQTVLADKFSVVTLNQAVDAKELKKMQIENPLKATALELTGRDLDKMTGYLKTPMDARVKDAFWSEIQPVLLGQGDPKTALDKARDRVNRELARP